jgi:hypothetical protein
MAPPTGTWNINADGTVGTLTLSASSTGAITGTVFGDPLTAVWDETSQILSFSRATQGAPAAFAFEVYTGTLFPAYASNNGLVSGQGVPQMLAGNFGQATVGGSIGPFDELGWFATSETKLKEKEQKEKEKEKEKEKDKDKDLKEEVKDVKEKEIEKPADKPVLETQPQKVSQEFIGQSFAQTAVTPQIMGNVASEEHFAAGKSFVPAEERPRVGAAALRTDNQAT